MALFLVFAVAMTMSPSWAARIGMECWSLPAVQRNLEECRHKREELEMDDEHLLQRIAIKECIVNELIARRITLAEAVDQFARLMTPRDYEILRYVGRGQTDQERIARSVLAYVPPRVEDENQREQLLRQLHRELQVLLCGSVAASHTP
jgi:hypothetical protein